MANEQLKIELTAVDKTATAFNSIQSNMSKLGTGAALLSRSFTAVGATLASLGVLSSFKKLIDQGDAMNDLSKKTGIAVSSLSQFSLAAEDSGASIDTVANGMKKLSSGMLDSVNGNKQLSAIFSALGVSVKDSSGNMKSLDDVMLQVADAFQMLPDGATKSATAVALFGKNGVDLIPMLNEGSAGIKKYASVISDEFGPKADQFNDNLNKFYANLQRVEVQILNNVLPALNKLFDRMDESAKHIKNMEAVGATGNLMLDGVTSAADFVAISNEKAAKEIEQLTQNVESATKKLEGMKATLSQEEAGSAFFDLLTSDINTVIKTIDQANARIAELKAGVQTSTTALAKIESNLPSTFPARPDYTGSNKAKVPNQKALEAAFGAGGVDKLKEFLIKQRESIDLLALEQQQVGLTASEYEVLKTQKEGMNEINKMVRENAGSNTEAFRQEAEALLAEKIAMMQRNEEFKRSFEGGMVDGLKRVRDEFTNVGQAVSDAWVNAFSSMEDAFVNFVKTGKLDFKSLTDSIISDLARIAFRQMISGLFSGFNLSSLLGGQTSAPMLGHAATGGNIPYGRPTLVGEKGMEIFTPSSGGRVTPNNQLGGSNVSVNVINNSSSQATTRETTDGRGNRKIDVVIGEVVAKQIGQIGSSVNQSLRNTFNSSPALVGR
jgi:cell division septum initiation protein DivIVA